MLIISSVVDFQLKIQQYVLKQFRRRFGMDKPSPRWSRSDAENKGGKEEE
jgi:hypothetical protein